MGFSIKTQRLPELQRTSKSLQEETFNCVRAGKGMNSSEKGTTTTISGGDDADLIKRVNPPFRPVKDDTKPLLQDPILRSDPIETEEAVLMLPPFRSKTSSLPK